ncbi:MAG: tRNA lysidine(34) synthetase TilS [Bacilli bacterium]|nr:tRNA lysidine(34) synthetase TilS [Bacilli bacterium]
MIIDLQKHIESLQLFKPQDTIIVALSGGVDSMVLFDVLQRSKLNLNLIIAHVNHKKRIESEKEFEAIKHFAIKSGVPFEGFELEKENSDNFQNESRNQRYTFFKKIATKYNTKKIVLAHHLDDQVETILMRIIRGTTFSGYAGINDVRIDHGFEIIRPLLDISKQTLIDYAKTNDIYFYEDQSNKENVYTRNRFRNKIIPILKEENPNLDEKINQFRDFILSADIVLNRLRDEFFQLQNSSNKIELHTFKKLDRAIKFKVLTQFINNTTGNLVELKHEQIVNMIELCESSTPNQRFSLGKKYVLIKEYDFIYVDINDKPNRTNIEVNHCGEYFIEDNHRFIFSETKIEHIDTNYFELCYNDKVFPLYLRNRKNGDKINLSVGTKKIKDIFIDQKIPVSRRNNLILVSNEKDVLWIPGIKKSNQNPSYKNTLYIYEVKSC